MIYNGIDLFMFYTSVIILFMTSDPKYNVFILVLLQPKNGFSQICIR